MPAVFRCRKGDAAVWNAKRRSGRGSCAVRWWREVVRLRQRRRRLLFRRHLRKRLAFLLREQLRQWWLVVRPRASLKPVEIPLPAPAVAVPVVAGAPLPVAAISRVVPVPVPEPRPSPKVCRRLRSLPPCPYSARGSVAGRSRGFRPISTFWERFWWSPGWSAAAFCDSCKFRALSTPRAAFFLRFEPAAVNGPTVLPFVSIRPSRDVDIPRKCLTTMATLLKCGD